MNKETKQEIQNILDRNFTRGDNQKAFQELIEFWNTRQEPIQPTPVYDKPVNFKDEVDKLKIEFMESFGSIPDSAMYTLRQLKSIGLQVVEQTANIIGQHSKPTPVVSEEELRINAHKELEEEWTQIERIRFVDGFFACHEWLQSRPQANEVSKFCECEEKIPAIKAMWVVCEKCNKPIKDD